MLSYAEFTRALHTEGTRVAVLGACVQRRVQLKVIFYALAGESGRLTLGELANGVERVLLEQADDHWGFSVEEMRGVINAEVFRGRIHGRNFGSRARNRQRAFLGGVLRATRGAGGKGVKRFRIIGGTI